MSSLLTGLDRLLSDGHTFPGRGRIGLLCNNAATDRRFRSTPNLLHSEGARLGFSLERIFSPQHGFAGEKQDNMVESGDGVHTGTGVPMVSLYGRVRQPEPAMLDGLDAIVIDLPDVGTRVYTFLSTALLVMKVAAGRGLPVIVLDRPNPIGDAIEGPMLRPGFESFVGVLPVPLRHGLTVGEYCRFGRAALDLGLEVSVIEMRGYRRKRYFDDTELPWVMPSPNMPTLETAVLYPGGVLLEGVNLSEGRGTTRPFELWGAPWLNPSVVAGEISRQAPDADLRGFALREVAFEPTFHKFRGETVRGFQVHVTDRGAFRPVAAWTAFFVAVHRIHPDRFAWREPPYEYEHERLPIDLIAGSSDLRLAIDAGADAAEIVRSWSLEETRFRETTRPFWLYV